MARSFRGQSAETKTRQLFRDFQVMGGRVKLLDYEKSGESFTVMEDGTVLGGFGDLQSWGPEAVRTILAKRKACPFNSWEDFYRRTPWSLGQLIERTGIHTGELNTDAVLSFAPWYPEVHLNEIEIQVKEKLKCFPIRHLARAMEREDISGVPIVGRVTALRTVDLVAQAKKYGGQPPGPGEPRTRAVVTITDNTGSVDVPYSAQSWEEIARQTRIVEAPEEGRGTSVVAYVVFSGDRTRLYGESLKVLRPWKRYEVAAPTNGNKMSYADRERIGGQLALVYSEVEKPIPGHLSLGSGGTFEDQG
jgi:hypothetical protein